ncbi:MAG: GntR family transcriptional regulator [Silicimonas sp.]|nr:GntR family transcriptional regulator [Silicimonas sp.]
MPDNPPHSRAAGKTRDRTVARTVYDTLRRRILDLDLVPDTTLSRTELAKDFQVSLTPLRDALQLLEQDGLVRIFPQSRTLVTRIDRRDLLETHFLRVAAETEVVRRLARRPDMPALKTARACLDKQTVLVARPGRMDRFSDLDRQFHLALFEGVGMGNVHAMLQRKLGSILRCQRLDLPSPGKLQEIVAGHKDILDRIEAADPEGAAGAMRAHLSGSISRVSALRNKFPDYFVAED